MMATCREEATAQLVAGSGIGLDIAINAPIKLGEQAQARHTLLHLAAMRGWTAVVRRLVDAGAGCGLGERGCRGCSAGGAMEGVRWRGAVQGVR